MNIRQIACMGLFFGLFEAASLPALGATSEVAIDVLSTSLGNDSLERFVSQLRSGAKPLTLDRLIAQTTAFNADQRLQYKLPPAVDGDSGEPLPEGLIQIEALKAAPYFLLEVMEVVKGHSNGIDGGVDRFSTLVLRANPVDVVETLPARTHAIPGTALRLAIGDQRTCEGEAPGSQFRVIGFAGGFRTVYRRSLPENTSSYSVDENPVGGGVNLETTSFSPLPESAQQQGEMCEVGEQVLWHTSTFRIRCTGVSKASCRVSRTATRHVACQPVGSCD